MQPRVFVVGTFRCPGDRERNPVVRELDRPVGDLIDMVIDALVATAVAKLAARSGSASRP
jgi:hypothetical protein